MSNTTLNLHITDRCNFHCKHCFISMANRELSLEECKKAIDAIYEMQLFTRINLAGGEPMLVKHLQNVIDYVVSKGFQCSIITNGKNLTKKFIQDNKLKLSMIGISIDSMDDTINRIIGRKTIKNVVKICEEIKNAGIKLKINICVSKHNLNHDFNPIIKQITPDRLKILQILPSPHLSNPNLYTITENEFLAFCKHLESYNPICENNEHMKEVYWIVDSEGYLGKDNLHIQNPDKIKII